MNIFECYVGIWLFTHIQISELTKKYKKVCNFSFFVINFPYLKNLYNFKSKTIYHLTFFNFILIQNKVEFMKYLILCDNPRKTIFVQLPN